MKNHKLMMVIFLLLSGLLLFAACGGDDSSDGPEFLYVPQYTKLPESLESLYSAHYYDGMLYFTNMEYALDGVVIPSDEITETDWARVTSGSYLYKMAIDGTGLEKLSAYTPQASPEGKTGGSNLNAMTVDETGNIWVVENVYTYSDDPENYWYEEQYFVRKLDQTGAELLEVDLAPILNIEPEQGIYISYVEVDTAGNLYLSDGNQTVYVLDTNGALLFKLELENWVSGMTRLADGRVGVVTYGETAQVMKPVNITSKGWDEDLTLGYNMYQFYPGSGDYLYYCGDGNNLYGYDTATAAPVKLLNWINSDIDSNNLSSVYPLPDGRILCLSYSYDYSGNTQNDLIILTKTPASEVQQKTALTLATVWLDYDLRSTIIEFNKTNPDYRIEVADYSEYNTEENYNAGLTKLNTEIISGNVPDIICNSGNLPVQQYVAKGLLEDLYTYIDNDGELARDQLVPGPLKAMEMNGGLYQVTSGYNISTLAGSSDFVGEGMGWTIDELLAAVEQHPEASAFSPYMTRDSMLYYLISQGMGEYIDWSTGECSFDNPSFIKLLEFINTFPAEYDYSKEEEVYVDDYTLLAQGQILLTTFYAYDLQSFYVYDKMLNGHLVFKGFPSDSGNGHVFSPNTALSITSKCKDKDAAWQFVRTLLTEEYQKERMYWGLPTNQAVFDDIIEEAMTPQYDENGAEISQGGWGMSDGTTIEIYAMTQEEVDKFMELINAAGMTMSYDESLMTIIQEEVAPFFAGQKSAADTASVIQSRVNIYVNEQR